MMILQCLATIWKAGGIIERLPNGELELKNHSKVPETCMKAANAIFDDIDKYLISVEGMNKADQAIWKMMMFFCGWLMNDDIKKFFNTDESAAILLVDYQVKLDKNGWKNIYDDYRQFENAESDELKQLLIRRIVEFGKGAK